MNYRYSRNAIISKYGKIVSDFNYKKIYELRYISLIMVIIWEYNHKAAALVVILFIVILRIMIFMLSQHDSAKTV